MVDDLAAEQRRVTKLALDSLARDDFALAGSGAIREYGLIDRPTQDIDLFTVQSAQERFDPAVDRMIERLQAYGYVVSTDRRHPGFAQLTVTSSAGIELGIDLGIDWRAEPAVTLALGPVLARDDAVGNKVAALFSRGEVRDFLDVDAIRQSGRYSDADLYRLAKRSDGGFTLEYLAQRLAAAERLRPGHVAEYGVTPVQLDAVKERLIRWRASVLEQGRRDRTRTTLHETIEREVERRRAEPGDDESHRDGPVGRGRR